MAMSVNHGLVGPNPRQKCVGDGQQVNIPVLRILRDGARGLKKRALYWIRVQMTSQSG